jgi:hypothetical protein
MIRKNKQERPYLSIYNVLVSGKVVGEVQGLLVIFRFLQNKTYQTMMSNQSETVILSEMLLRR